MLDRLSEALSLAGIPTEHILGVPGAPVIVFQASATQQQRTAAQTLVDSFDWSAAIDRAWRAAKQKGLDARFVDASSVTEARALRALVLVLIDELNDLQQWIAAFKSQTAAATNLANFQSRVAGLPAMADRTAAQARIAIRNKINAGDADQ